MIKLFTLKNIRQSASEALYKICLTLDKYGLDDSNVFEFESYERIFEETRRAMSEGDYIIIATDTRDFLEFKFRFLSNFTFLDVTSPGLSSIIRSTYEFLDESTFDARITIPQNSIVHASSDGLYSGFSVEILSGLCTIVPLDFGRLDSILSDYIVTFLDPSLDYETPKINIRPERKQTALTPKAPAPDRECREAVAKMVYSLIRVDRTIALANSEAALHIYNLYDKIGGLSDSVSFVEIVDPEEDELERNEENENQGEQPPVTNFVPNVEPTYLPVVDEEGNRIFDDEGNPVFEAVYPEGYVPPQENDEEVQPERKKKTVKKETASEKTIRHAREAMRNMNSSFGGAISEVYSTVEEDGIEKYFVFIAIGDGKTVKATKISTTILEEANELVFHAITTLCKTITRKIDAVQVAKKRSERVAAETAARAKEKKEEKKKVPIGIIVFAILILAVAIGSPLVILRDTLKRPTSTLAPTLDPTVTAIAPETSSTAPILPTDPTLPGANDPLLPNEPSATEVSANTTAAPAPSTKGTFTFTVYGYGHGVGLSQDGANYFAKELGWNYGRILANYFYGTTLMTGDTYPEKINYCGTDYNTRDLIACALEAEMGPSFAPEALKAQAVCIYTFAKYYGFKLEQSSMAYKSNPSTVCYAAADFVIKNGLYISANGQTALTPFHATSAGKTTSYYNAWGGTALPYLAGGRPSRGDFNAKDFKTTVSMTSEELKALIETNDNSISLSGDPSTWISILTHDAAVSDNVGYVSTIRVGGKEVSGNTFRTKLLGGKIRSHCFSFTYTPEQ